MPESDALAALRDALREIHDLEAAASVLDWDQATYMPPGGAAARGRQIALLNRLAHERRISPRMAGLLRELRAVEDRDAEDGPGFDDAALVRVARREHERAAREPPELVQALRDHLAHSFVAWTSARERDDFASMVPIVEKTVELSRRLAECQPGGDRIADALIDKADPGMTSQKVQTLFSSLREQLAPLVRDVAARPAVDTACLRQRFDVERQIEFATLVVKTMGYDFSRGRRDETHHPFMTRFSAGDIRITTVFRETDLTRGLFGAIHEAGHALYELNVSLDYDGSPLGQGASAGVHESQSRLWENLVGRGQPFWSHFYPRLVDAFPAQLASVDVVEFHRALNEVRPSLIRVEADELTYNLHVMLRFDLELAMLEGQLAVKELPDAWNERMARDLGCRPSSDREGVLQDVHWYADPIGGGFQGYTLGNVMSAQFYAAALSGRPTIPAEIARGELAPLAGWLSDRLYRFGSSLLPDQLVERATGRPLSIEPYVAYLRDKYSALYGLEDSPRRSTPPAGGDDVQLGP